MKNVVKNQGLKPTIAFANLQDTLKRKYADDSVDALLYVPTRRTILQTFSRQNKPIVENFNPLEPPEELYVSLIDF